VTETEPDTRSALADTAYDRAKARVRAGAPADAEARLLVARMTLDEKLGCLDGDTDFWTGLVDMVSGGYYRHPFPAARVARLGFPGLRFSDGPRGIVLGASTCFPVAMARGATFDVELEERIGEAIGIEARIQGADFFGGVCVNLLRHPGWGRAQETYGEDPCHLGEMGAALTRGAQRWVMACVKHLACNSIENARFRIDVTIAPEVLDNVYLPHFRRVVDEGVASVMTAYNSLNGHWCGDSRDLVRGILRERWGFDGFVVSDFVYGLRDAVASVKAGLDIEMPFRQQRAGALAAALADGSLLEEEVDATVLRVVRTVLRFDAATPDETPDRALLAGPDHRRLAREAAADAIVLLRNEVVGDTPLLPLHRDTTQRIAVLGRLADAVNLGDGGSSNVHPPAATTVMAGLREALPNARWTDDAAAADLAILVVGFTMDDEGEYTGGVSPELFALMPPVEDDTVWSRLAEAQQQRRGMALGGDRRTLGLRPEDEDLIANVAAVQPHTIVLIMAGSAVTVETWIEKAPAVLQVWYPGMEGGHAIADVLTGVVNPNGRLPFAVPTDEAHLAHFDPDATAIEYDGWHGQWLLDRDGHAARFPFGFGLSYTRFEIRSTRFEPGHEAGNEGGSSTGSVVAEIANVGATDGAVVVFFLRPMETARRLFAFRKTRIRAGGVASVRVSATGIERIVVALHAHDPRAVEIEVGSVPGDPRR